MWFLHISNFMQQSFVTRQNESNIFSKNENIAHEREFNQAYFLSRMFCAINWQSKTREKFDIPPPPSFFHVMYSSMYGKDNNKNKQKPLKAGTSLLGVLYDICKAELNLDHHYSKRFGNYLYTYICRNT